MRISLKPIVLEILPHILLFSNIQSFAADTDFWMREYAQKNSNIIASVESAASSGDQDKFQDILSYYFDGQLSFAESLIESNASTQVISDSLLPLQKFWLSIFDKRQPVGLDKKYLGWLSARYVTYPSAGGADVIKTPVDGLLNDGYFFRQLLRFSTILRRLEKYGKSPAWNAPNSGGLTFADKIAQIVNNWVWVKWQSRSCKTDSALAEGSTVGAVTHMDSHWASIALHLLAIPEDATLRMGIYNSRISWAKQIDWYMSHLRENFADQDASLAGTVDLKNSPSIWASNWLNRSLRPTNGLYVPSTTCKRFDFQEGLGIQDVSHANQVIAFLIQHAEMAPSLIAQGVLKEPALTSVEWYRLQRTFLDRIVLKSKDTVAPGYSDRVDGTLFLPTETVFKSHMNFYSGWLSLAQLRTMPFVNTPEISESSCKILNNLESYYLYAPESSSPDQINGRFEKYLQHSEDFLGRMILLKTKLKDLCGLALKK